MKTMKPKLIGSACSLMEILSLIEKSGIGLMFKWTLMAM